MNTDISDIQDDSTKVFVIGGLGRIGFSLSSILSRSARIFLYDLKDKVDKFNEDKLPDFHEDCTDITANFDNIQATHNISHIQQCKFVIIAIQTPVDEYHSPKLDSIFSVINMIEPFLTENHIIIIVSTLYPGTSNKIENKLEHKKVKVSYCPERVLTGNMMNELLELDQIISANDSDTLVKVKELFKDFNTTEVTDTTEAELIKLFTNVYRYIHFAIPNLFFYVSQDHGIDFYSLLNKMKKNYPRLDSMKGAGFTAGSCLRKDTLMLGQNKNYFNLAFDSMHVNEHMPVYVVRKLKELYNKLHMLTVGILGMTFKPDCDDTRDSLSIKLRNILKIEAKGVMTNDPYVQAYSSHSIEEIQSACDIVIIATPHMEYKNLKFTQKVIDVCNFYGNGSGLLP